jgi:hypothetical protein
MKEVVYPKFEEKREYAEGETCSCGGRLYHSTIPCPEGKIGCLVIHYGYICEQCGKIYQ